MGDGRAAWRPGQAAGGAATHASRREADTTPAGQVPEIRHSPRAHDENALVRQQATHYLRWVGGANRGVVCKGPRGERCSGC